MPCSAELKSCVDDLIAKGHSEESAWAICKAQLGESMHPDFTRIFTLFIKRYGALAKEKFDSFIKKNSLDIMKAYNPKVQFQESFEWVEPLIQSYTSDTEAKYYLVRALTANISLNNNDYSDFSKMAGAAATLSWRPVNLNHDHEKWLPYPRTRVDFSSANELSVEATLRVDNRDKWLQDKLDKDEIIHPSIEGRPSPTGGYHFTGLALLEKGVELPGDPLTEILPLAFNESIQIIEPYVDGYAQLVRDVLEGRRKLPEGYYLVDVRKQDETVTVDKKALDEALRAQKRLYEALKKLESD
jgi:hypothetical protein